MGTTRSKKLASYNPFVIESIPGPITYAGTAYKTKHYIYGLGKGNWEGREREQTGIWYLNEDMNYNISYAQGTSMLKYTDPPKSKKVYIYVGSVSNSLPHGYGKLNENYNGRLVRVYKGFFKNDLKHGMGWEATYYYYMNTRVKIMELIYEGKFSNGKKTGIGKCSIKSIKEQKESIFYGTWKLGKIHGLALKEKRLVGLLASTSYLKYEDGVRISAIRLVKDREGIRLPQNEFEKISYSDGEDPETGKPEKCKTDIDINPQLLAPYLAMKEDIPPLFFRDFKTLNATQLNYIYVNGKFKFRFKSNDIDNTNIFAKGEYINTYEMAMFNFFEYKVYDLLREANFKHISTNIGLKYFTIPSFNETRKPMELFQGNFRTISSEKPIFALLTLDFYEDDYLLSNIMNRLSGPEYTEEFLETLVERLLELFLSLEHLNIYHGSIKESNIFCFYDPKTMDLKLTLVNFSHANIMAKGQLNNRFSCGHEDMFNQSVFKGASASKLYELEAFEQEDAGHANMYEGFFYPFDYQKSDIYSLQPTTQAIWREPFNPNHYMEENTEGKILYHNYDVAKSDIFAFAVLVIKVFLASLEPKEKAKSKILSPKNIFVPNMTLQNYKKITRELEEYSGLFSLIRGNIDECLEGRYNHFSEIEAFYELELEHLKFNPLSKEGTT